MFYLLAIEAQQSGSQKVSSRGQHNDVAPFFTFTTRNHHANT